MRMVSRSHANGIEIMAKKNTILLKLENPETGYFYVKKRNPRKQTEKLKFRKYDPVLRKHVLFTETKIK